MLLNSLILEVTKECNYNCGYCYSPKSKAVMSFSVVEAVLDLFSPYMETDFFLAFYGGEPLLAYPLIIKTVESIGENPRLRDKTVRFAMTTNGSLLTNKILAFLSRHRFHVTLSFDTFAQDQQRRPGSFEMIDNRLRKLLESKELSVGVNSVFTPETIDRLYDSVRYLIEIGVPSLNFNLSPLKPWKPKGIAEYGRQLSLLSGWLDDKYPPGIIPPVDKFFFLPGRGGYSCSGGKRRIAVTPEGRIWGCSLFSDYFGAEAQNPDAPCYFLGDVRNISTQFPAFLKKTQPFYDQLRTIHYYTEKTPCFLCPDADQCNICPISAAFRSGEIGKIPEDLCQIQKTRIRILREFHQSRKV